MEPTGVQEENTKKEQPQKEEPVKAEPIKAEINKDQKNRPGKKNWKPFLGGMIAGALVVCLVFAALIPGLESAGLLSSGDSAINRSSQDKLRQLEKIIDEYYYEPDEVTKEAKEEGMYKGLLSSLDDPYTEYYTAEEMDAVSSDIEGVFGGIGAYISIDQDTGYPKIAGVMDDSPAKEAGLREDDIIYKVDGEDVGGLTAEEVVSKVRGEVGTDVTLTIARTGESDYLEFTITRAEVSEQLVDSKVADEENGIGYIAIAEFSGVATDEFKEALTDLYDQNIKALILDLRGNPGGDVDVVTAIADEIIPEGLVFYMEDRDGNRTEYTADGENEMQIPLVVLVNGNSASASEILSGAIQDSGKGIILGEQTYGKGVVQTLMSLSDGSAVKITTANYFTRNGNNINKVGITPDVKVDFDYDAYYSDGTDNQYDTAVEILKEELSGTSMEDIIAEYQEEDSQESAQEASSAEQ